MTRDEFINQWTRGNPSLLSKLGRTVIPCCCSDPECQGWQVVSTDFHSRDTRNMHGKLRATYIEVLNRAEAMGLSTDFEIHVSKNIADELGLGDILTIEFDDFIKGVPVIVDDIIHDRQGKDGIWLSDIYIYDPQNFVYRQATLWERIIVFFSRILGRYDG